MSALDGATGASPRRASTDALVVWLIGPVFLAAAAWFLWGGRNDLPVDPAPPVARQVVTDPPRVPIADPPMIEVAGYQKKCTECHQLFRSNPEQALILSQHRDIVQQHGMNDLCFNCHDNVDRERLVLPRGRTVPFSESPRLCAKCHGTTFRDWELGMHGRTVGSWDDRSPDFLRLTCVQCHDPHAPAFAPMATWPAPRTMRMGHPTGPPVREHGQRNPLRQWSGGAEEAHP